MSLDNGGKVDVMTDIKQTGSLLLQLEYGIHLMGIRKDLHHDRRTVRHSTLHQMTELIV